MPSMCEERKRLLDDYGRAVELLVYLGRRLSSTVEYRAAEDYRREAARCERVRRECLLLRDQLNQHSREHRCGLPLAPEHAQEAAHAAV